MRKICYVTGTRADYGLMRNTLLAIHDHPQLDLCLLVTGMHLLPKYGETWREIVVDDLPIAERVSVSLSGSSGAEMANALGEQVIGFTKSLQGINPDFLMLLGDRGEMLAGAIAALHLNIPIIHIHGGELSGTIDESVRHAISKLSHYHFTTTKKSRDRLIRMGEKAEHIFVTGAPGLDAIAGFRPFEKQLLFAEYGLNHEEPLFLVLFHPVVQQAKDAAGQMLEVMDATVETRIQSLVIMPNSDAGGLDIVKAIERYASIPNVFTAVHVDRRKFLSLMYYAELLLGNSSSGIIEAASLATPVVNIGDRQWCRERNLNVIDAPPDQTEILLAIAKARKLIGQHWDNIYGKGETSFKIVEHLINLPVSQALMEKVNTY